jgi:NlpE N-terminal domain
MFSKNDATMRVLMGSVVVAVCVIALAGCGKKQAKESETSQATQSMSGAAMTPNVVGMYAADLPAADSTGRKVSLMLNADHTAMMTTDYMNDQPALTQMGRWTNTMDGMVDVMFASDAGDTMTMSFHPSGNEMHMMNPAAAGYGEAGVTLMKQENAMPDSSDSMEGHEH